MPKQRSRIIVVMSPAAYKLFEEWLKQHPQYHTEACAHSSAVSHQHENKEVGHESVN